MESLKDLTLSGAGVVSGGQYNTIKISGGGKVSGDTTCRTFICSGSVKVEGKLVAKEARVSGGAKFMDHVNIDAFKVSGGLKIEGNLKVKTLNSSGGMKVSESIEAESICVTGAIKVEKDISAEIFELHGMGKIKGLLNAGQITIDMEDACEIGAIGAESVLVKSGRGYGLIKNLFSNTFGKGAMLHCHVIEADEIDLENTVCNTVRGKNVRIGDNCAIKVVEYTESIKIAQSAVVEKESKV